MNTRRRPTQKAGVGSNQYATRPGVLVGARGDTANIAAAVERDGQEPTTRPRVTETEAVARVITAARVLREQIPTVESTVTPGTQTADKAMDFAVHIARLVRDAGIDIDADLRVPEEELVAFAFTNPEASKAGLNPVTYEADRQRWDNDTHTAEAHRQGATWWDAPRDFGGVIPVEWSQQGWINPAAIATWSRGGFPPLEARVWSDAHFAPEGNTGAPEWVKNGFTLDDAVLWREQINRITTTDKVHPSGAAAWRAAGFTAGEMREFMNAGHTFKTACKARAAGTLTESRLGPNGIPGQAWAKVEGIAKATNRVTTPPQPRSSGEWSIEITHPDTPHKQVQCIFGRAGNFKKAVTIDGLHTVYGTRSTVTALKDLNRFLDRHLGVAPSPPAVESP